MDPRRLYGQQVALRARILVEAARGQSDQAIAQTLGVQRRTAALWRRRACESGIGCVWEIAAGRGRKPHYTVTDVKTWIDTTLQSRPAGSTH